MGRIRIGIDNALIAGAIIAAFLMSGALQAHAATQTPTLTLLDVRFLNDNQGYEPTTDAERQRLAAMQKQFAAAVSVPASTR
jgi:hypothetical protein